MVNQIKLDKIGIPMVPVNSQQPSPKTTPENKNEDVTVTNHLSKLVQLLTTEEPVLSENTRVNYIKQKIEKNEYKVDFDVLTEKLLNSGVLIPQEG